MVLLGGDLHVLNVLAVPLTMVSTLSLVLLEKGSMVLRDIYSNDLVSTVLGT